MAKTTYNSLTTTNILEEGTVASLGNSIILNDNLDSMNHIAHNSYNRFMNRQNRIISNINITLCLEGTIHTHQNLVPYHLKRGDVVLARSGSIGEFNGMSDDAKLALIVVDNNFYFPIFTSSGSPDLQNLTLKHPVIHLPEEDFEICFGIYQMLKKKLTLGQSPDFIHEIARGLVQALIFNIYAAMVTEKKQQSLKTLGIDRKQYIYDHFIEAVQQHYSRERSTKFYADLLCITPKYLSQVVYKVSGNYAQDYIRDFVIAQAKALLKTREYTVQQICDILNFNSLSFFSKYFKNATGVSPAQFQNS